MESFNKGSAQTFKHFEVTNFCSWTLTEVELDKLISAVSLFSLCKSVLLFFLVLFSLVLCHAVCAAQHFGAVFIVYNVFYMK